MTSVTTSSAPTKTIIPVSLPFEGAIEQDGPDGAQWTATPSEFQSRYPGYAGPRCPIDYIPPPPKGGKPFDFDGWIASKDADIPKIIAAKLVCLQAFNNMTQKDKENGRLHIWASGSKVSAIRTLLPNLADPYYVMSKNFASSDLTDEQNKSLLKRAEAALRMRKMVEYPREFDEATVLGQFSSWFTFEEWAIEKINSLQKASVDVYRRERLAEQRRQAALREASRSA